MPHGAPRSRAARHGLAVVLLAAAAAGCGEARGGDASVGMDAGIRDARAGDAGLADGGLPDASVWVGEGCNEELGIECDGDWRGRCEGRCSAAQCCAPVSAEFVCVARGADGSCPAADIFFESERVIERYRFSWRHFDAAGCAIDEACVDRPGWRRLLRFATSTPNIGSADFYLGDPEGMVGLFTYSSCHEHFHFDSYARYELRDASGAVVARGHKQSFCLLDGYRYPEGDSRGAFYTCENQGIQRGYQDVYAEYLDCQWIDVTDVPPGEYVLHVELNYEGLLLERDYSNNSADVPITVPTSDVTGACPERIARGTDRNCGLDRAGSYPCVPGERIEVACSSLCGAGSCSGDPFLRVCDALLDPNCDTGYALADNDNSYCDMMLCGLGGDCCPRATAVCPTSGEVVVYTAAWDPALPYGCDVVVRPAPTLP